MASDKTQHDTLNNQKFGDIYIHASQEPWVQFYPGMGLKLLRGPMRQATGQFF